ncbi:hypothetical protein [Actinomadura sp. 7K507]|uniref:hypothetical protein n=1 Tax=Actinomadura sp. 7K507 TaxID=2530365 RepID=UPI001A9F6CF4|nr:hypothetical protein [Actinomadura sp. 7K507]
MSKRPITVQAAAALEAAEGLVAVGFGVYTGVETAAGAAVDPASAIGVTVLALGGGLGMLASARGLLRAEPWSRSPTVLTQLFALPVAWTLWQSERPAIAIPLALVAVLALVTVLSPPSTAWLLEEDDEDDEEKDREGDEDHGGDDEIDGGEKDGLRDGEGTEEAPPQEPRSLGRRLMDRLKEQPTKK